MPNSTLPPGRLLEKLAEARHRGHWLEAIQHFTNTLESVLKSQGEPDLLRCQMGPNFAELLLPSLHRQQNQCPFIQAYRTSRRGLVESGNVERLIGTDDDVFDPGQREVLAAPGSILDRLQAASGNRGCLPKDRLLRGLELRLATILCLEDYLSNAEELTWRFKKLVLGYQSYWDTKAWNDVNKTTLTPTAAWLQLHSADEILAETVKNAIVSLKANFLDPAVAFLIDTLCELRMSRTANRDYQSETEDGRSWHRGDTYGLLMLKDALGVGIRGIVARLRIECIAFQAVKVDVSIVPGSIYPHPHMAAYSQIDNSFQKGIRNAWLAVCGARPQVCDYRWSLIPVEYSQGHDDWLGGPDAFYTENPTDWFFKTPHSLRQFFLYLPFSGPSATLPYALAIRSVQENQPKLRKDLVSTAAFKIPNNIAGESDCNELAKQWAILETVGQIPKKSDIPELAQLGIGDLVLATNQAIEQPTKPPYDNPIRVPDFETAWSAFSHFESCVNQHADRVSQKWTQKSSPNQPERLDLFVWPQLEWEEKVASAKTGFQQEWTRTNVEGIEESQLTNIFRRALDSQKHLVVNDGAGAGKTVVSFQFQNYASDLAKSKTLFADGQRRLVFRWEKHLPKVSQDSPKLGEILIQDADLQAVVSDEAQRRLLVAYALGQGRVVIILDGWDEFLEQDRHVVRGFFDKTRGDEYQHHRFDQMMWIVLGRPHAIDADQAKFADHQSNSLWLHDSKFLRLHIALFDEKRQDDYFEKALAGSGLPRGHWRQMMGKLPSIDPEIVSLPHTLREIFRLIEVHREAGGSYENLPKFVSLSDLFLQTSKPLLMRSLTKVSHAELARDQQISPKPELLFEIMECALSCIAVEMATQGFFVLTVPNADETGVDCVSRIENSAYERFASIRQDRYPRRGHASDWEWAMERLRSIALNYFSSNRESGSECLAFRNRRVLENYAARYLTWYETEKRLLLEESQLPQWLEFIGHKEWKLIWRWVIETPIKTSERELGAKSAVYRSAIRLLFARPAKDAKLKIQTQRRPTELMWQADQWIKSQSRTADSPLIGFDLELRNCLGEQFRKCLGSEDERKREVAQSLIDANNYVILADKKNPEYTDEEIKKYVPGFDTGRFKMGEDAVEVTLSKFGMGKYAVSNEQFQLFDDNFAFEQVKRSRFGGKLQPCVFVSWFDSYWFGEFVGCGAAVAVGDCKWRVEIPSEAQFEYAHRAGCQGGFFYARQGGSIIEVDRSSLPEYAHFSQDYRSGATVIVTEKEPNAWNLRLAGNVWKWVYDYYGSLKGGQNPVATSGSSRVIRGGSWLIVAANCESTDRYWFVPSFRRDFLGVVLALSPAESPRQSSEVKQG